MDLISLPPYDITSDILKLIEKIGIEIGILNISALQRQQVELRKENKIRTIHASLAIEGNTLSLEAVTDIMEGKKIIGPSKDIKEVKNAIEVYKDLRLWNGLSEASILKAHELLMTGLLPDAGKWRKGGVAVYKEEGITHIAPPANRVESLMNNLFHFINTNDHPWLIKACVFHYELEFIHPFSDGNGRMGRLWQQVLLMQDHLIFEYLPVEEIIKRYQLEYYEVLNACDKEANSTKFIEFSLNKILIALREMPRNSHFKMHVNDRIIMAKEKFNKKQFSRKEYAQLFGISSATASRDLLKGVQTGSLSKEGDKALTRYKYSH